VRGVVRSVLLACGLVLAWALPAAAAPTWSAPVSLSGPGNAISFFSPSVAIGDNGRGVEAWSETVAGTSVIRVAQHQSGGPWTTLPGNISSSLPGDACDPLASVDGAGNALVVWVQSAGPGCGAGNQTILFATRAFGAPGWAPPQVAGTAAPGGDWQAEGGRNAAGQVVFAWETSDATSDYIFAAVGSPSTGFKPQEKLVTVPLSDSLFYLAAAIGTNGDAAVQWDDSAATANIVASVRPHAGSFPASPTAVTTNTAPASAYSGSIAVDAAGNVLSAYAYDDGAAVHFTSRFRQATSGTWQPQQTIESPAAPYSASWVAVGMDDAGNATAALVESDFSSASTTPYIRRLFTATRPSGGTWLGLAPLSNPLSSDDSETAIAVSPSGAAVIAWGLATPQDTAQAVYRPAGGSFGALTPIGVQTETDAAIAPSGDAAIASEGGGTPVDARVSVLDTQPPAFTAATVPATAATGQPVAMSATALDAWSGLAAGQPSWTFGDGVSGAGAAVSHTFAKAGTYTVTIGASDGVGLAAAPVTRQIVVTDLPVPPPPPPPATSVSKPVVKAAWKSSRLVGSITVSGTVGASTAVTITLRLHGSKKAAAKSTAKLKAGAWKRTLRLSPSLLPGRYDVLVSGQGVAGSQTSFTLAAPSSGIVTHSYASGPRRGPAVTRLASTSELWAHFSFGTLPAKGQKITTQWTLPGGRALAANVRPRTRLVEAEVKQLAAKALPTGLWRCVIRAGGVVVATVNVRLS
jgi:PKD domain